MLLVKFLPEVPEQTRDFILQSISQSHRRLRGQSGIVELRLKENLDLGTALQTLREFNGVLADVEPNSFVERAEVRRSGVRSFDVRSSAFRRAVHSRKATPRLKAELRTQTIIGVIDTGIDLQHRDLKDLIWSNAAEKSGPSGSDDDRNGFTDDKRGWNFVDDSNDIDDDNGHGTQIAGIIAQSPAPVSILPLKALDHTGRGTIASVVEAIDYAVARHAAVINCSFGAPVYSRALLDAIKRAETAGIVVVAAAGNNGQDIRKSSFYPASYQLPNLISVAATDEHNLLASFSNYSADIAAPGTGIRTADRDNSYVRLSGTSAAAGFVSATAGLLKSKRGWVSAQTIRDTILESVNQSFNLNDKVSSKGTVNPQGALSLFTRDHRDSKTTAPATNRRMTPAIKAALQSGNGNLDTMRSSQPQAPNAYQQTGTLPPASYTDPAPAIGANFAGYLTQMSVRGNASGIAGSLPLQPVDPTAGSASAGGWSYNLESRNYNFTAPVISLPGRAGMGLSLALSYNSKPWIYDSSTNTYAFNPDRGFPAPGWRIGFGAIQVKNQTDPSYQNSVTGKNSLIYIAPDGTRHDLAHNPSSGYFEAYDSSYLRYDPNNKILQMPSGLKIHFQASSYTNNVNQLLPTYVIDRNGNYINIYYRTLSNNALVMDYIIDTANRRIDFNYQNNRLISVSQNRNGNVFKYVNLDYQAVTIQTNFPGDATADPANINGTQVYFPGRITFPTGVNYRFSYTSYGQIYSIQKWVPTIPGQGNERVVAYTSFNLEGYSPSNPVFYSPQFTRRTEWAENWQGGSTQTYLYTYDGQYGHEITDPSYRGFRVQRNGTVMYSTIIDSGKSEEMTYVSDSGVGYISNPRVSRSKTTASNGSSDNVRLTNYSYLQRDGMWLVEHQDDVNGLSGALYRRTTTGYTSYPSQYILGLPQQVSVYTAGGMLLSRITNNYDETGAFTDSNGQTANYFIDATGDGVIQHNASYHASFTERGNLTSVVQSSVVNGSVNGSRIVKRVSYDTNGNVRAETDGAGNRRQILYTDNYSNKPGGVGQTAVQAYTIADPTGFRSGSQQNYYTGQTIKTFNLTPGSSTESQVVTTGYDFADRPLVTTRPDGGRVRTDYWDNWLTSVVSQQVDTGKVRFKFDQSDGAGRIYRKASDHPDGVAGKYSGQVTVFDKVGQTEDTSNVIAITGAWSPTAEDASTGFLFTHLTRDALSRLKIVTFPDNNTRQYDYTGCGCAGESETRVTDELGHYTMTKTDFLGRLIEAIEPSGTTYDGLYSKAKYIYDELDRLKQIDHLKTMSQITGHTPTQTRTFSYDGYGRLQSENTPEGGIVNYTYKPNDLVETVSNQRNITVTNSYNTRNLLTQVSYSDGTPTATFAYDAFGAREKMTDGEGVTTYVYNNFRQLEKETRTFTGLSGRNFALNYTYNLADMPKSVNYVMTQPSGSLMPEAANQAQIRRRAARRASLVNQQVNHSIGGTVRLSGTNEPMAGVTVKAERQDDPTLGPNPSAQTNSSGSYSFEELPEGATYKVTPSKDGYHFSPASVTEELNEDKQYDFSGAKTIPPSGTLSADPNPVQVCDGTGRGATKLTWTASGTFVTSVEIRKGSPTGPLVTKGGTSGSFLTDKTVTDGTVFYLQDVTSGNTLATVTVNITTQGCPPPVTSFNKTINYAYNSVGALSGVGTNLIGSDSTATTNVLNSVTFRGSGAIKSVNYGNGRRLQMGYNANRQQPTSMKVDLANNPGDKIIDYTYEYYDANGNNNNRIRKITDAVDGAYTTEYFYDDYNRLTRASAPAYTRQYGFDEWGNVTNFEGLTLNYATNSSTAPATNRISTAVGTTTWTHSYDAAGNMTGDGQQTFSYDGANRMKEAGTGGQNTYGYDGDGMRVRVVANGSIPTFYFRSSVLGQTAFEVNQNLVLRAYVYAGNKLVAQQSRDGQFYWVHTNHLGNGMRLTDTTGAVKYRAEYAPYGQTVYEWSASGDTYLNTKKFATYERDEATGLDYANARMYTSGRGRFMQPDPMGLAAANPRSPQSLNRYSYVQNDPINFVDPSGLQRAHWRCSYDGSFVRDDTRLFSYTCALEYDDVGGGGGGGRKDPSEDPGINVQDKLRKKEQEGLVEAGKKLKGPCNEFYEKLIQETAQSTTIEYPNGNPGIHPPLEGASTYVLNLYMDAMNQGHVTNSNKSGSTTITNPDGTTTITTIYGTTSKFSNVEWNNEFYSLSASDRGFHTLHEALHQVAGFTDRALAEAAQKITNGGPIGGDPSGYLNKVLGGYCK